MHMRTPSTQPKHSPASPLGHKGPRAAILVELKRGSRLTATELAARLESSLNAIRHHLKELEAEALIEHNCAIRAVAERFPEVCAAEARFLESSLGAEVRRESHILSGCGACGYSVKFKKDTA